MSTSSSSFHLEFPCREHDGLAAALAGIELEAGLAITMLYDGPCGAHTKNEDSEADLRAEAIILDRLVRTLPGGPILPKQAAGVAAIPNLLQITFVAVELLDGTKEFIAPNRKFNFAPVEARTPTTPIVYTPAKGLLFGADRQAQRSVIAPGLLGAMPIKSQSDAASSLKFCCLAAKASDVYPRFDHAMKWDTAAAAR